MNNKFSSRFKNFEISEVETKIPADSSVNEANLGYKDLNEIKLELENDLLDKINSTPVWFDYTYDKQAELIKMFIKNLNSPKIKKSDIDILAGNILSEVTKFGPIQHLLENDKISAVIINDKNSICIEIDDKFYNTEIKLDNRRLIFVINALKKYYGCDNISSIKTLRNNEYSTEIVTPEISENGYLIVIRKIKHILKEDLIESEFLTKDIFNFLVSIIAQRKNIVISGEVNSGKSTLLNVLSKLLSGKRTYLIENICQSDTNFDTMVKFCIEKDYKNYDELLSIILKSTPDYILCDLNKVDTNIYETSGIISTINSSSIKNTLENLTSTYISSGLSEKYAKIRLFKNCDYIIQIDKINNKPKLTSIVELTPGKTVTSSIKHVVKYVDGKYILDF